MAQIQNLSIDKWAPNKARVECVEIFESDKIVSDRESEIPHPTSSVVYGTG